MLLSGGMDSAACVHFLISQGYTVSALFVGYGQATLIAERCASRRIASHFGISLQILNLSISQTFPTGELTGRNAFLIFSAVFLGRCHSGLLVLGLYSGTSYYDCSPDFFRSMSSLLSSHTNGALSLIAPFLSWHKGDVYEYAKSSGIL